MNYLEVTIQAATQAASEAAFQFGIFPEKLLDSLPIMGLGMFGIFVVTGVIVLTVGALNKLPEKEDKD